MAKGKDRALNPADAYRKLQRKKEVKKNKEDRARLREVITKTKDTTKLQDEIERLHVLGMAGRCCCLTNSQLRPSAAYPIRKARHIRYKWDWQKAQPGGSG
jgi:hypothetical protein